MKKIRSDIKLNYPYMLSMLQKRKKNHDMFEQFLVTVSHLTGMSLRAVTNLVTPVSAEFT